MVNRTCRGCGVDISGMHGNAVRCLECRFKLAPPSKRTCRNGCDAPVVAHDMCARCYVGDVRAHGPYERLTPDDLFWMKIRKDGPIPAVNPGLGPCWLWTASTTQKGAPIFQAGGKWLQARRFAWERLVGAIPDGVRLRGVCGTSICVNPGHAEPALPARHVLRSERDLLLAEAPQGTPEDCSYWAALLDGEGHIGIHRDGDRAERPTSASKYVARVALCMSDRLIVEEFAAKVGRRASPTPGSPISRKPLWRTEVNGAPAAILLRDVLPFLRIKRRQAELLIMLEAEKRQPGLRTRYTSTHDYRMRDGRTIARKKYSTAQEHIDRWHSYFLEVQRLNRLGR